MTVAANHLDKDIREDGITAAVDENGCVRITQVLETNTMSVENSESQIVCTSLLLMDDEGRIETNAEYIYYTLQSKNSGGFDDYAIYATQTAYFSARTNSLHSNLEVKLSSMKTAITYGTTMKASKLVQEYKARPNVASAVVSDSKTINSPSATSYSFTPSGCQWYNATSGTPGGYIATYATVTVGARSFIVEAGVELCDVWNLI